MQRLIISALIVAGLVAAAAGALAEGGEADADSTFPAALDSGTVSLFTGAASYSLPLELPTGPAGIGLPLALTYNSDLAGARSGTEASDGGWVGLGWRLDVGRIELTSAELGKPRLRIGSMANELAYVGRTVEACSDANGWTCTAQERKRFNLKDARFFRVEKTQRSWRRRVCDCDVACAPPTSVDARILEDSQYQVWTRSGLRYDFGTSGFAAGPWAQWSAGGPGGSTRAYQVVRNGFGADQRDAWFRVWGLEKVVDPHGNTIHVDWVSYSSEQRDHDCGAAGDGLPTRGFKEIYPRRIRYSTNPGAGDHHAEWEVRFDVRPKAFDLDADRGIAHSGFLLHGVDVVYVPTSGPETVVRAYRFDYLEDTDFETRSYRLHRVRRLGLGGEARPALSFDYALHDIERTGHADQRWFLTRVDNGLGGAVTYSYGEESWVDLAGELYRKPVVASRVVDPGVGPTIATDHVYRAPILYLDPDDGTRRLVGFGEVETVHADRIVVTGFHGNGADEDDPLNGRRRFVQTQTLSDDPLSRTEERYTVEERFREGGGGINAGWFTYVSERREFLWAGGARHSKKTVFRYHPQDQCEAGVCGHQWGNLTRTLEFDDVDAATPFRSTWTPHIGDTAAWIVDRKRSERVFAGALFSGPYLQRTDFVWRPGDVRDTARVGARGLLFASSRFLRDEATGANLTADTRRTYDAFGNLLTTTMYSGYGDGDAGSYASEGPRVERRVYDAEHHAWVVEKTNPEGHSSRAYHYAVNPAEPGRGFGLPGQLQISHDVGNDVWRGATQYDAHGRVTHVWGPGTDRWNLAAASRVTTHDDAARTRRESARVDDGPPAGPALYQDRWVIADGLGRTVQTQRPWTDGRTLVANTRYDDAGRRVAETAPIAVAIAPGHFDAALHANPFLAVRRWAHDALGRVVREIGVDGLDRTHAYVGPWGTVATEDPARRLRRVSHVDTRGHAWKTEDFDIEASGARLATIHRDHDALGRLTRIVDPIAAEIRFDYDTLGRTTLVDDPDRGLERRHYDAADNLVERENAADERVCTWFDALDRRVAKLHADAACPVDPPAAGTPGLSIWIHDGGRPNGIGQLALELNAAVTRTFEYDERGRLATEEVVIAGAPAPDYTTHYTYDHSGRPATRVHPDGVVEQWRYDVDTGLPIGVATDTGEVITHVDYTERQQIGGIFTANGLFTLRGHYSNSQRYRLGSVAVGPPTAPTRDARFFYGYDANGNTTLIRDDAGPASGAPYDEERFEYDALGRLELAWSTPGTDAPYDLAYEYDASGNLIGLTDNLAGVAQVHGYDPVRPHALSTVDGRRRLRYDAVGRVTWRSDGRDAWTLTWDADEHVTRVRGLDGVTRFVRGPGGELVRRIGPDSTTYYVGPHYEIEVAGESAPGRSADAPGRGRGRSADAPGRGRTGPPEVAATQYFTLDGRRYALRRTLPDGAVEQRYLHYDALGSVALVTDEAGDVVHRLRHLPFGADRWSEGSAQTDHAFAGERRLGAIGGVYEVGARLYDPLYRRWLSADTEIPDPFATQQINRYAYVVNNPLRWVDPTGHGSAPSTSEFLDWLREAGDSLQETLEDAATDATVAVLDSHIVNYRSASGATVSFGGRDVTEQVEWYGLEVAEGTFVGEALQAGGTFLGGVPFDAGQHHAVVHDALGTFSNHVPSGAFGPGYTKLGSQVPYAREAFDAMRAGYTDVEVPLALANDKGLVELSQVELARIRFRQGDAVFTGAYINPNSGARLPMTVLEADIARVRSRD